MANLEVKAAPAGGVIGYTLIIDGAVVPMNYSKDEGTAPVAGNCGDGSPHRLNYDFEGPVGATLSVVVSCAGIPVCTLKQAKITSVSVPYGGGFKRFSL